jgi:uncharacterized repeat protein (TIGR01451 family)
MKKLILLALLMTLSILLFAEQYTVGFNQNEVNVVSTGSQETVLEMTLGHFNREAVRINNDEYWALDLKKEGFSMEPGMPQLPYITRSIIIPGTARMTVQVLESEYTEIVMPVAPSKGNLTRDINPDDIPYTFDSFYQGDGFYPTVQAELSEPFIIRDYRGITVYMKPFVYYPATKTLRIYTRMLLSVTNSGTDNVNIMATPKSSGSMWFDNIYQGLFLNYNQAKYPVLEEQGRILIVTNSMFNTSLQPYIEWKRQKGFVVNVVDIAAVGPTATQLKTYIQSQYDLNNGLMFVQIMGDHAQVPSLTSGGGASDPSFALLAGADSYPDIFVGRFSAQTVAELDTQILRSVQYERDMQVDNPWLANAMGIASNEGGGSQGDMGESDQVHMELIRTDLLGYGYNTVDQVYQALGATIAMVSNGLNAGRGFVNYVGHGSDTSWSTTGFSNTNVNQLTNDNKLPFIVSVACVNGNFTNITCFAEAWVRARDTVSGNPRGALAIYASSINQSWNSPMRGQDEITDLMIAHQKNTIGGLFFNGSSRMVEVYGTDGSNMYKTWHIFGDASLMVRTTDPQPLTAQYMDVLFLGMTTFSVQTAPGAWVTLSYNGDVYGTGYADATGNALINLSIIPDQPMDLTLTITAFNKVTHISTIQVLPSQGAYVQVTGQAVSDNNNNQADSGETVFYDIVLNNVGSDAASNVVATLTTTDQYVTILSNTCTFGDIPAGQTSISANAYVLMIADNVPDQHVAVMNVAISQNGVVEWSSNLNLVLNAPAMTAEAVIIDDSPGNNNGRIEGGETVLVTIPVTNTGHATASDLIFSLMVQNPVNHVMTPVQYMFTSLAPNQTVQVIFEVTFSSQVPAGTQVQFLLLGISGQYSLAYNFTQYVGMVMENFDNGTMTAFPWTFTGGNWTLDTSIYHSPGASAKSAVITHNQSTTMSVTMQVPDAGTIAFWKKVSSEQNYDFLKFYINNALQNQWSGNVDWSQETYNVTPGQVTFKWEYMKDNIVSSGSDCAWIDDIVFPSTGGTSGVPVINLSTTEIDFGSHMSADFEPVQFTIANDGDATMIGTVTGSDIFRVKPAANDTYATAVNFVIPAGLSMNFHVMVFPINAGLLNYSLLINSDDPQNAVSYINMTATVLPTSNPEEVTPLVTALKGNYPNPFNPTTTVYFSLKQDSQVRVDIYNILGQKVKTLVSERLKAGNHGYRWNGKDDSGRSVSSGIYFYRMNAGSYSSTAKMVLMK